MHDMGKLKNLKKLDAGAPDAMKAFWEFDKAVFKEGEISALNKQLIAVAVALTTQCAYCIEIHTKQAREAGGHRRATRGSNDRRRGDPSWRGDDPWNAPLLSRSSGIDTKWAGPL